MIVLQFDNDIMIPKYTSGISFAITDGGRSMYDRDSPKCLERIEIPAKAEHCWAEFGLEERVREYLSHISIVPSLE